VGNCKHSAILELLLNDPLDYGVVLDIDVGCRLVDQHDLASLQEGPADAQQLLFSS
jgi:hypothetical protein